MPAIGQRAVGQFGGLSAKDGQDGWRGQEPWAGARRPRVGVGGDDVTVAAALGDRLTVHLGRKTDGETNHL